MFGDPAEEADAGMPDAVSEASSDGYVDPSFDRDRFELLKNHELECFVLWDRHSEETSEPLEPGDWELCFSNKGAYLTTSDGKTIWADDLMNNIVSYVDDEEGVRDILVKPDGAANKFMLLHEYKQCYRARIISTPWLGKDPQKHQVFCLPQKVGGVRVLWALETVYEAVIGDIEVMTPGDWVWS